VKLYTCITVKVNNYVTRRENLKGNRYFFMLKSTMFDKFNSKNIKYGTDC